MYDGNHDIVYDQSFSAGINNYYHGLLLAEDVEAEENCPPSSFYNSLINYNPIISEDIEDGDGESPVRTGLLGQEEQYYHHHQQQQQEQQNYQHYGIYYSPSSPSTTFSPPAQETNIFYEENKLPLPTNLFEFDSNFQHNPQHFQSIDCFNNNYNNNNISETSAASSPSSLIMNDCLLMPSPQMLSSPSSSDEDSSYNFDDEEEVAVSVNYGENNGNNNRYNYNKRPGRPRTSCHLKQLQPKATEKRTGKLWEFLRNLLLDRETCPSLIKWDNYKEGTFKFVQSEKVAQLWGNRKKNTKMNYEKLSRAMRYYYRSEVLLPVSGKRLVYKFGPQATGWQTDNPILS